MPVLYIHERLAKAGMRDRQALAGLRAGRQRKPEAQGKTPYERV